MRTAKDNFEIKKKKKELWLGIILPDMKIYFKVIIIRSLALLHN